MWLERKTFECKRAKLLTIQEVKECVEDRREWKRIVVGRGCR